MLSPDSPFNLYTTLLDPSQMGLRLPQTDLAHLRDFSKFDVELELKYLWLISLTRPFLIL